MFIWCVFWLCAFICCVKVIKYIFKKKPNLEIIIDESNGVKLEIINKDTNERQVVVLEKVVVGESRTIGIVDTSFDTFSKVDKDLVKLLDGSNCEVTFANNNINRRHVFAICKFGFKGANNVNFFVHQFLEEVYHVVYCKDANSKNGRGLFQGSNSIETKILSCGDNITNMSNMFRNCNATLDLDKLQTGNVTDMSYMFADCSSLTILNLSNFNTIKVINMRNMFSKCSSLKELDLSKFNTSNVTNMSEMFSECSSLTSLDLKNFDTSKVTEMNRMFYLCSSLTSLDLSNFKTDNVTDMSWMFAKCYSLKELDLKNFDTSNVTGMSHMFFSCSDLTSLNLSNWTINQVIDMNDIFAQCDNFVIICSCRVMNFLHDNTVVTVPDDVVPVCRQGGDNVYRFQYNQKNITLL